MDKIKLIIWREFITRVRKPSFIIMTILGPLLIAGGTAAVVFLGMQESGPQSVLVIDKARLVTDQLKDGKDIHFFYRYEELSDSAFKAGPYTLMVEVNEKVTVNNTVQFFFKDHPSQTTQNVVSAELEKVIEQAKLKENDLDPETYRRINTSLTVQLFDIDKGGKRSYDQIKATIGFFMGYIMFFFIFMYGVQVMRGVMEEKQSRIVEVLISSVKPFQLMMGKIIGIAFVGLVQFVLWIILSTLLTGGVMVAAKDRITKQATGGMALDQPMTEETRAQLTQQLGFDPTQKADAAAATSEGFTVMKEILDETPITLVILLFLFYFLFGYLLYSSLFASIGAAVDNETDTQQFMLPVMLPMVAAIFIAQTAIVNPDGPAVFWFSIIPFTSPIVMMIRIAMGNAFEHPWELILSMVLLVATFIGTTWLAGRIYRTGILMYGKKVSWKELGKWLFYKG
jgi:ABC-2 type transport system permease protein